MIGDQDDQAKVAELKRNVSESELSELDEETQYMVVRTKSIFYRIRMSLRLTLLTAFIAVVTAIAQREIHYREGNVVAVTVLRFITTFSCLGLLISLYYYNKEYLQFRSLSRVYLNEAKGWTADSTYWFIIECLICIIHEPPFVNQEVNVSLAPREYTAMVNNPWGFLVILKLYVVFRVILNEFYSPGSQILGMWHNFNFSIPFSLRHLLASHPGAVLAPLVLSQIFSFAYFMSVCERGNLNDEDESLAITKTLFEGVWLVTITMTGVGYGDIFPLTSCGRIVSITASICSILTLSIIIATFQQQLTLFPYESKFVEFLERHGVRERLRKASATLIVRWYRFHRKRKRFLKTNTASGKLNNAALIEGFEEFDRYQRQTLEFDRRYNSDQLFRNMLEAVLDKIEELDVEMKDVEANMQKDQARLLSLERGHLPETSPSSDTGVVMIKTEDVSSVDAGEQKERTDQKMVPHGSVDAEYSRTISSINTRMSVLEDNNKVIMDQLSQIVASLSANNSATLPPIQAFGKMKPTQL